MIDPVSFLATTFSYPNVADDVLSPIVRLKGIQASRTDADGALMASDAFPGYLSRRLGPKTVFVPFNLASVFPGHIILNDVVALASTVSLDPANPVCLSGSAAFLGSGVPIADLDFCEYFLGSSSTLPVALERKIVPTLQPGLVRLKLDGDEYAYPWTTAMQAVEVRAFDLSRRVKLDSITCQGALGILPTTCVTLLLDSGMRIPSFTYQEAVIADQYPPRSLSIMEDLRHYFLFLSVQVSHYRHTFMANRHLPDALKALKRAMSFFLLIGAEHDTALGNELEFLISFLASKDVAAEVAAVRIGELERWCAKVDPLHQAPFHDALDQLRSDLYSGVGARRSGDLEERAAAYVAAVDDAMTDIFEAAGLSREGGHVQG